MGVVASVAEPALELVPGTAMQVVNDHSVSIYSTDENRNVSLMGLKCPEIKPMRARVRGLRRLYELVKKTRCAFVETFGV